MNIDVSTRWFNYGQDGHALGWDRDMQNPSPYKMMIVKKSDNKYCQTPFEVVRDEFEEYPADRMRTHKLAGDFKAGDYYMVMYFENPVYHQSFRLTTYGPSKVLISEELSG